MFFFSALPLESDSLTVAPAFLLVTYSNKEISFRFVFVQVYVNIARAHTTSGLKHTAISEKVVIYVKVIQVYVARLKGGMCCNKIVIMTLKY